MTEATNLTPTSGNVDPGTVYDNSAVAHPGSGTAPGPSASRGATAYDTESRIRERIRTSAPFILESVRHFEKIDRKTKSLVRERHEESEKLIFAIQQRNHSISSLQFSAKFGAGNTRREIITPPHQPLNPDGSPAGGQTITTVETNDLALLEADQAEDLARLKALKKAVPTQNWLEHIRQFLGAPNLPDLIEDGEFPELLDLSQSEADGFYQAQYRGLTALKDELESAWNAPRTKDEAKAAFMAWLENEAREGAPGVNGFFRGYSERNRKRVVNVTNQALGWQMKTIRFEPYVEVFDGEKAMAWLFKDQIKKKVCDLIDNAQTHEAISAEAKPQVIREIESRLYGQRRVVEIAARQLENAGVRFVRRPAHTPLTILLRCQQFKGVQPVIPDADAFEE